MKNQLINNNYSTLQLGNNTVQSLTIDGETFVPVRELLVALGVTNEESVSDYMRNFKSNYILNIKNSGCGILPHQLKFRFKDNKYYKTDSLNVKDVFKFIDILEPRNKELKAKAKAYFHKMEEVALGKVPTLENKAKSIATRRNYTDIVQSLSSSHFYFATATDYVYEVAFGLKAKEIRERLNVPKGANIRYYLSDKCIQYVTSIENILTIQEPLAKEELKDMKDILVKSLPNKCVLEAREDTKLIDKTIKERVLIK